MLWQGLLPNSLWLISSIVRPSGKTFVTCHITKFRRNTQRQKEARLWGRWEELLILSGICIVYFYLHFSLFTFFISTKACSY